MLCIFITGDRVRNNYPEVRRSYQFKKSEQKVSKYSSEKNVSTAQTTDSSSNISNNGDFFYYNQNFQQCYIVSQ